MIEVKRKRRRERETSSRLQEVCRVCVMEDVTLWREKKSKMMMKRKRNVMMGGKQLAVNG